MTRLAVAWLIACVPALSTRADDPKPDVAKLKDEVELLEAKLGVWKAKVAGAEELASIAKEFLTKLKAAEEKGVAAHSDLVGVMQTYTRATGDLRVYQAELKVAEVKLTQARRRLDAAGRMGTATAKPEKTYAVRFENAKWGDVVNWFQKETGLVYAGNEIPVGGVTIKPVGDKRLTIAEVVDLLNEALDKQQFQLIRRQETFTLKPADERIESSDVPRINRTELTDRGKTETVQVLVQFDSRFEDTLLPFVKKLFRPDGRVTPAGDDQMRKDGKSVVILQDRAENVRKVLTIFDHVPAPAKAKVNPTVPGYK